jgi:hypothetical protein
MHKQLAWLALWRVQRIGNLARWILIPLGSAIVIAAVAYSIHFRVRVEVLPYDDAYITSRYVTNLLSGHGPGHNVSE